MGKSKRHIWIGPQIGNIQQDVEMSFLNFEKIPLIIGLTGPTKSGKTIIARRMISEHNFKYFNLSTFIREHAYNLGQDYLSWKKLRETAELLRIEYGNDVFARSALERLRPEFKSDVKIVLDGVLHPDEVFFLKKINRFHLVGILAPLSVRFEQAKRWYPDEYDSEEKLKERDQYEHVEEFYSESSPYAPNILECLKLADSIIPIEKGFTDQSVYRYADKIVEELTKHEASDVKFP